MCGVPVHARRRLSAKPDRAGFTVAVCEQMEDPAEARKRGSKSVVRRDVVRVVTPGTLTEDGLLDARGANASPPSSAAAAGRQAAVASVEHLHRRGGVRLVTAAALPAALAALGPSRDPGPRPPVRRRGRRAALSSASRRGVDSRCLRRWPTRPRGEARLKRLYGVDTLDGFGELLGAEIAALGLIATHLETTQAGRVPLLRPPRRAAPAKPTSWPSIRPPAPAWRSSADPAARATARCSPPSTAP